MTVTLSPDQKKAIVSLQEARKAGLDRYFTGKPCCRGHIEERRKSDRTCCACARLKTRRQAAPGGSQHDNYRKHQRRKSKRHQAKGAIRYLNRILRNRIRNAVRNGYRAGSAVRDLGCTIPEFRIYIATKFTESMSWDNYGEWHLDHIRPLASFDLTNREQFLIACHFTNFQPLWALDNDIKGATW